MNNFEHFFDFSTPQGVSPRGQKGVNLGENNNLSHFLINLTEIIESNQQNIILTVYKTSFYITLVAFRVLRPSQPCPKYEMGVKWGLKWGKTVYLLINDHENVKMRPYMILNGENSMVSSVFRIFNIWSFLGPRGVKWALK